MTANVPLIWLCFVLIMATSIVAGLIQVARKIGAAQKEQDDARRRFAEEKGWRYTWHGNQRYTVTSSYNGSLEWEMTNSIGEDSSTTTWSAPRISATECIFVLQKSGRNTKLTAEQRETAYKVVGAIMTPFGGLGRTMANPLLKGEEYTLEQPAVREVFQAYVFDRTIARAILTPEVENRLMSWLRHPALTEVERESLYVTLGPKGLQVRFSGLAIKPETMALLVEMGTSMARGYCNR